MNIPDNSQEIILQKNLPVGSFILYSSYNFPTSITNVLQVKQVHGAEIYVATNPSNATTGVGISNPDLCDGVLVYFDLWNSSIKKLGTHTHTCTPHTNSLNICIKTADCLPIFILGELGVVGLHAGWRGLKEYILHHPLIPTIKPYYAYIGPCIHPCCYEVKEDLFDFFLPYIKKDSVKNKNFLDLIAVAKDQLTELNDVIDNVAGIDIEVSPICTYCNPSPQLASYRRDPHGKRNYNFFHLDKKCH